MAAAGSATKKRRHDRDGCTWTINWTADASGNVAEKGTTGKCIFSAVGYLYGVEFNPGTAANQYNLTLLDEDGVDVLRGEAIDQPNAAGLTYDTKYRSFTGVDGNFLKFNGENLTPTISDGGDGGTGEIKFKFSRAI
jgi:hypothetical protein